MPNGLDAMSDGLLVGLDRGAGEAAAERAWLCSGSPLALLTLSSLPRTAVSKIEAQTLERETRRPKKFETLTLERVGEFLARRRSRVDAIDGTGNASIISAG